MNKTVSIILCTFNEVNHIEKAIETKVGVVICATQDMKTSCGFDSAVGHFEKVLQYMLPLRNMLTIPIVVIGLEAPKTFNIEVQTINRRKIGIVRRL